MGKAVTKAYRINYYAIVYAHCFALGIELKQVWASLPFRQKCLFYIRRLFLETLYILPGFREVLNYLVTKGVGLLLRTRE